MKKELARKGDGRFRENGEGLAVMRKAGRKIGGVKVKDSTTPEVSPSPHWSRKSISASRYCSGPASA